MSFANLFQMTRLYNFFMHYSTLGMNPWWPGNLIQVNHCTYRLCNFFSRSWCHVFVAASHQTRLDTRSKARRPIKVGIKGRGRSGTSRDSNPACQCCSSAHLVQCEPDEASSFTNPNMGPGTYASLRLKLDAWSSAVQRGQKCSSPTRRLPSRSWGPIRPRVCSWFRAPIRHECQTAQLSSHSSYSKNRSKFN